MSVALIPARGGSKRITGKNIRPFLGKPIIAYSIEAALASGLFERVIVSTDSEEIASAAESHGASVPFRRPADLADDITPLSDVIRHALLWLGDEGKPADTLCAILATAPFVRVGDLCEGHRLLAERGVSSVFTVTSFPFPIFRALRIAPAGSLEMFWPEHELTRSNDLPEAYHDAGQFYWLRADRFLESGKLYAEDALPLVLPRHLVQDIDTAEDWERAELMYRLLHFEEETR